MPRNDQELHHVPVKRFNGHDWSPVQGDPNYFWGDIPQDCEKALLFCRVFYTKITAQGVRSTLYCTKFRSPRDLHSMCRKCIRHAYQLDDSCNGQDIKCPECSLWPDDHPSWPYIGERVADAAKWVQCVTYVHISCLIMSNLLFRRGWTCTGLSP